MTTTNAVLDEAYQRLHGLGPEFGGDEEGNNGLTNHGPMAVEVMVRRGLDVDAHQWLDGYVGRLTELPATTAPITATSWREALGDARRIGDWTEYFTAQLGDTNWREVLRGWWPRLLPGVVAGSTHGVIRVGHAVRALLLDPTDAVAATELGYGLAFWAARSRVLPGLAEPTGTLSSRVALATVPRLVDQHGVIAHRLDRLAGLAGWSRALAALCGPTEPAQVPVRLAELTEAGVLNYLRYGQAAPVLLVHAATAPNAVAHILPVLPQDQWLPSFAAAWAASAAIIATYAPADPAAPNALRKPPTSTADVLDQAGRHRDEHVIKFADTAVDVFDRTGDPDVLAAVQYAAGLIPSPMAR